MAPTGVVNQLPDSLTWTDFNWIGANLGEEVYEKAAIMLPLSIEGASTGSFWMQLDTGIYETVFYGNPFALVPKGSYKALEPSVVSIEAQVGSIPIKNMRARIMQGYGSSVKSLDQDVSFGSIGLDVFMGRVLVLDFPNSRLAVAPSIEHLPGELTAKATFQSAELKNGKLIITVSGEEELSMFYDTGSSIFEMALEPLVWERITGREISDTSNQSLVGPSWGEQVRSVFAEVLGSYEIAGKIFLDPVVGTTDSTAERFKYSKHLPGVFGLIGNALFYNEYVVILDLRDIRFGLVRIGE